VEERGRVGQRSARDEDVGSAELEGSFGLQMGQEESSDYEW
jgi:hypothetical protein